MKVSLNWVRQFTDVYLPVDDLVKKIGAQLGAVEEVIDLGEVYKGIVVAKVVSCEKHPNADKLSVCRVDDGGKVQGVERDKDGYIQVVCGAPNVRKGLKVAWLPPGSTVPSTVDKDPFVLEARELRGVMSSGMIASAHELAIGNDHNGIVELDTPVEPGADFAEAYELNDIIIDIENKMFTHRPDCFGILGVAREIAGIQGIEFKSPEWYKTPLDRIKPEGQKVILDVRNEARDLVPRFMAVAINEVQVGPSPFIMQTYLARVGLKPINNIVDITNYIMYLTGQPTHAYDADKLRSVSGEEGAVRLEARVSRKGDKLRLLDGKEVELEDDSTILITSGDVPVGIGGVMGGADTEVDESTRNIVLECANFDMYSVRRTSMKYGLFTDAVTRFNKGQSPLQNDRVMEQAVSMLEYMAKGRAASEVVDLKDDEQVAPSDEVEVTAEFINARLGSNLSEKDMAKLLGNVEFEVKVRGRELTVTPPYWRTDIEIPEDIVEEVGRLYGFDHLPIELPARSIQPVKRDAQLSLKSMIRDVLARAGANEVLTYSFVHGKLLDRMSQSRDDAFELTNALSPDLQYYRTSLTPSLLDKVHGNIKAGFDEFAIFEIGKSHIKGQQERSEPEVPMEFGAVSLVFAANDKVAKHYKGAAFYQASKYLETLLQGCSAFVVREPFTDDVVRNNPALAHAAAPYELSRSAVLRDATGTAFGIIGEFKQSIARALKLPAYAAGFEVGLRALVPSGSSPYRPLSRFPKTTQDISLRVRAATTYRQVKSELDAGLTELTDEDYFVALEPLDIYEKDDNKHFTFRLSIAHHHKTLKAAEVNQLLDQLAERAKDKIGAERI